MLVLKACKPGPLDEYEETIRHLNELYGERSWGVIARADDVMRSEGWERHRRDLEDQLRRGVYKHPHDAATPWASVIRDAARDRDYWQENVKDICLLTGRHGCPDRVALAAEAAVAPGGALDAAGGRGGVAPGPPAPPHVCVLVHEI